MEYARLLWEQMFSVGRVIAVPKASMRPRSASARGGSLAAHGKRVYSICGNPKSKLFATRHLMMGDILRPYGTLGKACLKNPYIVWRTVDGWKKSLYFSAACCICFNSSIRFLSALK